MKVGADLKRGANKGRRMSRSEYYEEMKQRARDLRTQYGFTSPRVMRSHMRQIYKDEGIKIDPWPNKLKNLRGAYFFDEEIGPTVMIAKSLPDDPYIFTLGHELKHHIFDRARGLSPCAKTNESEMIEIGAEVFAAELIFPEQDFVATMKQMGVLQGACTNEHIVRIKHETRTTLSYMGLVKRAEFLGFAPSHFLQRSGWKALEERIYGEPVYKKYLSARRSLSR